MTVKDLKKIFKGVPDDAEIILAEWHDDIGKTLRFYMKQAANLDHQKKVNEVWFLKNDQMPIRD